MPDFRSLGRKRRRSVAQRHRAHGPLPRLTRLRAAGVRDRSGRRRAGQPDGRLARRSAQAAGEGCAAARRRDRAAARARERGDARGCRWPSSARSPPRCCASAGSAPSSTARAPAMRCTGCASSLFGEQQVTRDDQVALAAQTEMQQVQQLIDQGNWDAAQDKLQTVTSTVQTVEDPQRQAGAAAAAERPDGQGGNRDPECDGAAPCPTRSIVPTHRYRIPPRHYIAAAAAVTAVRIRYPAAGHFAAASCLRIPQLPLPGPGVPPDISLAVDLPQLPLPLPKPVYQPKPVQQPKPRPGSRSEAGAEASAQDPAPAPDRRSRPSRRAAPSRSSCRSRLSSRSRWNSRSR